DMCALFLRPVEHRDHGQVEHAASLEGQLLTAPYRTPAVLSHQILERLVEVVRICGRCIDIPLAEHGGPDFASLVISVLIQRDSLFSAALYPCLELTAAPRRSWWR